ncbi:lipopolysaccharide biosynthesis protein [Aureliella helgolandensis]|uniref:MurJ-like flippase n=1 Tax=Aureliella helgolandensis TaxID=2527968 RepID=A0A518GFR7_9BACT|nr:oligosaccharide flippase family protein [Aureliella helgolandensis]QDV27433.1 MurJ-like flippase [Aureliella helgolandensis]
MSSASVATEPASRSVGDSFAIGVLVMLVVSVLQRCVGLIRGLGFCHFLSDVELGQWALANSFFTIAVPIAVLGLPGSFGKFVEYFRRRGQLGIYVGRVGAVSAVGLCAVCLVIFMYPGSFSWFIFGEEKALSLVAACVLTLACVTLFSFVSELVTGLRQVRAVSAMQFTQSLGFAVLGLVGLALYRSWFVLLPCFAIASLIGLVPGLLAISQHHGDEFSRPKASRLLAASELWQRILPFAAMLWGINLLSNLFEVSDRYMLLHLISGGETVGQAAVGQYHCGRILPNLLTSVAMTLGSIMLPYLSADWEAQQHHKVTARLRQVLQSASIAFLGLSIAAMVVSPWLFAIAFGARYDAAAAILPISLLQASWVGLFLIAQSYLLCAERGRTLVVLLFVGLLLNFALNWWLILQYGLSGAVVATTLAGMVSLLLLFWQMGKLGCNLPRGTLVLCMSLAVVPAGPIVASVAFAILVVLAGRTEWLLSANDRAEIDAMLIPKLNRFGVAIDSVWPR